MIQMLTNFIMYVSFKLQYLIYLVQKKFDKEAFDTGGYYVHSGGDLTELCVDCICGMCTQEDSYCEICQFGVEKCEGCFKAFGV